MFSRPREISGNLQHPGDQVDGVDLKGLSELVMVRLRKLREEAWKRRIAWDAKRDIVSCRADG